MTKPQDDVVREKIKGIINQHVADCMTAVGAVSLVPRHPGPAADAILAALRANQRKEIYEECPYSPTGEHMDGRQFSPGKCFACGRALTKEQNDE